MPSAKKSKLSSHQVFGVCALEVNKILQATPSKLRREMGMCATIIYLVRTAAAVFYDTVTRCKYSSLDSLVPGAAYLVYLVRYMQALNRLQIRGTGVCLSRVKTPCEQGLPQYTCYKQSNAFLMRRRRRSAVSTWNVDRLRNTTLRGIRSARNGLGQRSFRAPLP